MSIGTGPLASDALTQLSEAEFVSHWRSIVGEPPAIMLESRSEMMQLLVESPPAVPLRGDEQALDLLREHPGEG